MSTRPASRVTLAQLQRMFEYADRPDLPTLCD
jgi:hypothetical protein